MSEERAVGLIARTGASVPLEGVRVHARVSGPCVEVELTQRYRNRECVPVEAVYVFALDEGSAVCGFDAIVGDVVLRGEVLERERAYGRYDDALDKGDGAFLLEQERPNVFTASVGNLRPNEVVELRLRYVALLGREGAATRLTIPTAVFPRYVPPAGPEIGQPAGERVNPPLWPSVPYGLSMQVDIAGPVRSIDSPSHAVRTVLADQGAQVSMSHAEVALDRDFVLLIEAAEPARPFVRVARERDGQRVALLHFTPEVAPDVRGRELVFLLDCSGSMEGKSIAQAKRALLLCIRALGVNDTFNVVRFGSTHELLWKRPRKLDERSLARASAHVASIEADLGGTELMAPLASILAAPVDAQRERRVLLLTDGQVSNEAELFTLARRHAHTRIFALGIGAGASAHLVRGIARASRGAAEMISPGERLEPKVMRTFARIRTPALDDVSVGWGGLEVEPAPAVLPPLFAGDGLTLFARIERGTTNEVTLRVGEQVHRLRLDLELAEAASPIPTLWARERIRELEETSHEQAAAAANRDALVELATRYGLGSSATSFVAVEQRAPDARTTQPAAQRRIPVAVSRGMDEAAQAASAPAHSRITRFRAGMGSASSSMRKHAVMGLASTRFMMSERADAERDRDASEPAHAVQYGRAFVPASTPPDDDRVYDLLMTQRIDGRFPRSAALERWLTASLRERLDEAVAEHGEDLVITALVVALLERDARDREAEWRPGVHKATAWLAAQQSTFRADDMLRT